ncbi:hypothetical protein D7004_19115 [Pedobacter jejuensis]|uniref:Uncharacterized protein n=1 Tax=Pedobacter jejuensis TaxID=1268550 RepID=A0A3N0BNM2_9SPHI|nr:hypothetical protein D7004_19115 [Pedobacter jejuensis]
MREVTHELKQKKPVNFTGFFLQLINYWSSPQGNNYFIITHWFSISLNDFINLHTELLTMFLIEKLLRILHSKVRFRLNKSNQFVEITEGKDQHLLRPFT